MTLVIPPGFGHVITSLILSGDPEPMAITYGIEIDGPTDAQDLVNDLFTETSSTLMVGMGSQYNLNQVEVLYRPIGADPDDPLSIAVASGSVNGSGSFATCPQNTAYLVHKRTAVAGRRGRGRFYLPGVAEAQVGNTGVLDPTFALAVQGHVADWLAAVQGNDQVNDVVLLHSTTTAAPLPADLPDPTPVTAFTLDPVVATQRRRLRH